MTSIFMKGQWRHHSTAPYHWKASWGNAAPSHWPPVFQIGTWLWPRHTAYSRENEKQQVCFHRIIFLLSSYPSISAYIFLVAPVLALAQQGNFCSLSVSFYYKITCFDVYLCNHTICLKKFFLIFLFLEVEIWLIWEHLQKN